MNYVVQEAIVVIKVYVCLYLYYKFNQLLLPLRIPVAKGVIFAHDLEFVLSIGENVRTLSQIILELK